LRAARYASWTNVIDAFTLWFKFAKEPDPTPFWLYFRRLRACYRCPVFLYDRRTCGSLNPADDWPDGEESWGCGCMMPVKAKVLSAECWLHEQGAVDEGWPQE